MKQKRDKIILIFTCVVVTILVISMIHIMPKENYTPTIAAMEGRITADELAKKWHDDALLVAVGSMGSHDSSGKSSRWYYEYYSQNASTIVGNETRYEHAFVYVWSNGNATIEEVFPLIVNPTIGVNVKPIQNWTIDSDKAMNIAKENPQIKSFLSKYRTASAGLNLRMQEDCSVNAVWSIGFSDQGLFDNPHSARIIIDAHTGEVLNVETQMD